MRLLPLCYLVCTNPGNRHLYKRVNGPLVGFGRRYTTEQTLMNIDTAIAQVVSLRRVADDLQHNLNQMAAKAIPPVTDKEQLKRLAGYTFATVILRALAIELMLKALSFKKTGRYRKDRDGHDLLILFNDLDSDTRKIVAAQERIHGIAPLEQILEKHRGDFVEWRYLMEGEGEKVGFLDLDKALLILMTVYEHKDFLKSCQNRNSASLTSKQQT